VAVQSRAFSVGAAVAWAEAGVGAIATQSQTNESFGPLGLEKLRAGLDAERALEELLAADPGRETRQVGIVDASGRAASFTGGSCLDWAGDSTGPGFAAQGNILVSAEVVAAMVRAYTETDGELSERLLAALSAAQAAGGDKRGRQSASLLVVRPSERYPEYRTRYVDLRVEDHPTPIRELTRLFRIHQRGDLVRAHVRYAARYDSLGDAAAAARERERIGAALDSALSEMENDAWVLNNLAWFCASGDVHLEGALRAAQAAAALMPEETAILDTLAEIYRRLGRFDEAMEVVRQGLRTHPEDPYLLEQKRKIEEARAASPSR
ncbi:MAG: DUF1028 domain-containing protein, partial [Candidatus Latescibacteria bacterium]|nr:DUF1028 domain-containing protein [Candidatus Latescibacterota bacterium]